MKIIPNTISKRLGTTCDEIDVDLECELCGHYNADNPLEQKGFDTPTWRQKVLPTMECPSCGMSTHDCEEIQRSER